MTVVHARHEELELRLAEAEATIAALLSGQVDAVVHPLSKTPVLLAVAQQALHESEERYRRIVETTNEGVWMIDVHNKTTFMNRRMAQMLGCEADMGIGRSPLEFLDEAGRATLAAHIANPISHQVEVAYVRQDGTKISTLLEATPIFDINGHYTGTLAMVMDITERKRSEAALGASEARFKRLWESGVILITISDLHGKIIEINDAGVEMLGYSREELVTGRIGWEDITPRESQDADNSAHAKLAATGIASPWEKELVRKDGTRVSILTAAAILEGVEGITIAVDLSARKRAERDLLERMKIAALTADVSMVLTHEDRLRTALEQCTEAIVQHLDVSAARLWMLDPKTQALELQTSAGMIIEDEGQVVIGQSRVDRIAEQRQAMRINSQVADPRAGESSLEGVNAFAGYPLLVSDELVAVLAVYSRGALSDAAFTGLGAISDALALGIQRKIVSRTNAALESQLRQSQKMEAVGRLAGGIAHDFNNILSVILTCAQFLLDDLQPLDPARTDAEEIRKAAERAAGLTRQLLMFSRQQVLESKVVNLGAVAANLENMLRRVVGEDVELVLRTEPALGRVRVDPGSIEQVIMNLVVNARDAMPRGGTLVIETRNESAEESFRQNLAGSSATRHTILSVTDTGTGMDAATQAQIFEPFFTTKDVGKGTGLGLSTVFGIVQQSSGVLRVESEVGSGSTFSIYLPQVDEAADDRVLKPKTAARGTETILLVEDEDQVRSIARAILERHGYHVIEARSPEEALAHCQSKSASIDLLLTDVVMPQISGPELARQLLAVVPQLKILCMSGYTDDSIVRHGVLQAHFAFLQKPFTPESLTRKVREVLAVQPASSHLH